MRSLFFLVLVAIATPASAQVLESPFSEGVEDRRLSPEDRSRFLELADNARRDLRLALALANEMPSMAGLAHLQKTFLTILPQSGAKNARSELLMRTAIWQGLEIVQKNPVVPSLCAYNILAQSAELAIRYYQDDRDAILTGSLMNLPLSEYANRRLPLLSEWARCAILPDEEYGVWILGFKHWQNAIYSPDNATTNGYPEELLKNDDILANIGHLKSSSGSEVANHKLREHMKWFETKSKRLKN